MVITIEHLTHIYGAGTPFEKKAVDDVSLTLDSGQIIGVIGHTGSGKSTLIQHLNGLLKPASGRILLDGQDIWADKAKLRQVRFQVGLDVPQVTELAYELRAAGVPIPGDILTEDECVEALKMLLS